MDDAAKQILVQGLSLGLQALFSYFQQKGLSSEEMDKLFATEYAKFKQNRPETLPDADKQPE